MGYNQQQQWKQRFDIDVRHQHNVKLMTLPTEIIRQIFSFLSFQERLTCIYICKHWYNHLMIDSFVVWEKLVLASYETLRLLYRGSAAVKIITAGVRYLDLDFAFMSGETKNESMMKHLFFNIHWNCFEYLALRFPNSIITHKMLCNLLSFCQFTLRKLHLDMVNSDRLSNKTLAFILNSCTKLKHISLRDSLTSNSNNKVFEKPDNEPLLGLLLKRKLLLSLEYLDFTSQHIEIQDLLTLLDCCPNLQSVLLDIRHAAYKNSKNRIEILDRLLPLIKSHQLHTVTIKFVDGFNKPVWLLPSSSSETSTKASTCLRVRHNSTSLQHLCYLLPPPCFINTTTGSNEAHGENDIIALLLKIGHKTLQSINLSLETILLASSYYDSMRQNSFIHDFPCLTDITLTVTIMEATITNHYENRQNKANNRIYLPSTENNTFLQQYSSRSLASATLCEFISACPAVVSVALLEISHTMNDDVFNVLGDCRYLRSLSIHTNDTSLHEQVMTPQGLQNLFQKTQSLKELAIITTHNKNESLGSTITDEHIAAIANSGYQKLKRLHISNGQLISAGGLYRFLYQMHHSKLECLQLYNLCCITHKLIENISILPKLSILDLSLSFGSPHLDRTTAVHSLFNKRSINNGTLSVKITAPKDGIWPNLFDSLTFASDSYKFSMANQMANLVNSLRRRYDIT